MSDCVIAVTVMGVPFDTPKPKLKELSDKIKETISSIYDLEILPSDVFCFFPKDLLEEGLGKKIIFSYETSSVASLDANWKAMVHMRVERIAQPFFPDARIEGMV